MAICDCNAGLSALGSPSCQTVQSVTRKLIFAPMTAKNGAATEIPASFVSNDTYQEYIISQLTSLEPANRWFASPFILNVEDTKGDSTFESLSDGSNIFIQEGARTFTGEFVKQSVTFLEALKVGRCVDLGVYLIDLNGNLIGSKSGDTFALRPIRIDKETFNPILVKGTDTTVQKVSLSFEFDRSEKDEDLRMISGANFLQLRPQLGVKLDLEEYNATQADVIVTLETNQVASNYPYTTLTESDFVAFNTADPNTVYDFTLDTTNAGQGFYSLVWGTTLPSVGGSVTVVVSGTGGSTATLSSNIIVSNSLTSIVQP